MSCLMEYYNKVNNAYLNGEITYDEHKNYMESLSGSTHKSLYSLLFWGLENMSATKQGDISFLGDDLLGADRNFYRYVHEYWCDGDKISPDIISNKSFDELNSIVQNTSESEDVREKAAVAAMINIRQGYLDGTYTYADAKSHYDTVTSGVGAYLASATGRNSSVGLSNVFYETEIWLDAVEKYDSTSFALDLPTYINSNTNADTST